MSDDDVDREAWLRASYLEAEYDLRWNIALAQAYSERGFSSSGIAKKLDVTEATVKGYRDSLSSRFGPAALDTRLPDELAEHPNASILPARLREDDRGDQE